MIVQLLSPYLLVVMMLLWQAAPPLAKAKPQAPGDPSTQKTPEERFESLLAAAMKEPKKADWNALRHAFSQTDAYQPYNVQWREESAKVAKDIHGGNLKAAETALVKLLERERFMRLDAIAMAVALYEKMGEKDKARKHRELLQGLAETVFVRERGMSFEKPIEVLFIDEEYLVVRSLGLQHKGQSLREKDGHHFDVLTLESGEGQPDREIYFNIDMPFNALGRSLGGAIDRTKNPGAKK